ncbi:MAG: ribbon-helix-helix protein, CopG family [Thermoanaerobaculia bacterium]
MNIVSVRLQEDLEAPLEGLAERLHRSRNWLINQAVREFIERRQIEETRWQETVEALRSIEAGQGIPEGEVHAWLASWGQPNERKPPGR